jgi:hypothetical protein
VPPVINQILVQTSLYVEKLVKFDGKGEGLERFIIHLRTIFLLQMDRFPTDRLNQYRFLYATSLMTGSAFDWVTSILMNYHTNQENLTKMDDDYYELVMSWEKFMKKLKEVFGDPSRKKRLAAKLLRWEQKGSL